MSSIDVLQGIWKVVRWEENGVQRASDIVEQMACLVLLGEKHLPDSDGSWGCIRYFNPLTSDLVGRSITALRRLINGVSYEKWPDFHIYSGGILYLGRDSRTNSIDFVVYHGAELYSELGECSVNRGIYRYDGARLTVCSVDAESNHRPTQMASTEQAGQSLAVYARETTSIPPPTTGH